MALISEFEQVAMAERGSMSDQPQEAQDTVKMVNTLLHRAKAYRRRFDQDWLENYDFVVNGNQWPVQRPRWRFNESVNILWANIMQEIAIQTDTQPKFDFSSQEIDDQPFTDILSEIHSRNWDQYKWNAVVMDCLFFAKIYHVAHAEVTWDEDLESGLGDVHFRVMDPYHVYWDGKASDVNKGKKARYIIEAEPHPTSELKIKYPEHADQIKPDVINLAQTNQLFQGKIAVDFDPFDVKRLPVGSTDRSTKRSDTSEEEAMTTLIRIWLRDDTLEEVALELDIPNSTTGEQNVAKREFILKKKYPKGRYIEVANNIVLRDGAPGVVIDKEWVEYDSDKFPVARLVNYQYAKEYAGENEVTQSRAPQKIVNYLWSYILDMFRMQANPKQIITRSANLDAEKITNEPGLILEVNQQADYRQEPGAAIAAGSFELLKTSRELMDTVYGLQDVSRGAVQTGVDSGVLLEGFIEASQTRPRLKNRNLDEFLQDIGELMLERYMQFYTRPRVRRIVNQDGYPEAVEFSIPTIDQNGNKVAIVKVVSTDPQTGQKVIQGPTQMIVKGSPDVKVTSGSALPFAKAQKAQRATNLFAAGAIDREELLKAIDWPNYEEVLKRISQLEQAQAQQAQLQGK